MLRAVGVETIGLPDAALRNSGGSLLWVHHCAKIGPSGNSLAVEGWPPAFFPVHPVAPAAVVLRISSPRNEAASVRL